MSTDVENVVAEEENTSPDTNTETNTESDTSTNTTNQKYTFSSTARIPVRPLSLPNADLAMNKEVIVDYVKHKFYLKDENGEIVPLTGTAISDMTITKEDGTTVNVEELLISYATDIENLNLDISNLENDVAGLKTSVEDLRNISDIVMDQIQTNTELVDALKEKFELLTAAIGYYIDEDGVHLSIHPDYITVTETKQFVSAEEKTAWNNKADIENITVSIPIEGWTGEAAPYSIEVNVESITVNDYPVVDVLLSEDYETSQKELENFGLIYKISTFDGYIKVYATKVPEVALNILIKIDK